MRKNIALLLAFALLISLSGCGGNKKAFTESKTAYDQVTTAYEITERFSSDIYEAWRIGIYDRDKIVSGGCEYLASELSLSEDEIWDGLIHFVLCEYNGQEWESITDEQKQRIRDTGNFAFKNFSEDNLFTYCVGIVVSAYKLNGKTDEAQTALDSAKSQMKMLSEDYSDYEHYPNLKGYYTATKSYFDFCQNPAGSFEQIKDTINNYRNEARDYLSDLDYIFEE